MMSSLDFTTKMLHAFIVSIMRVKCPAHVFLLDLITLPILELRAGLQIMNLLM